MGPLTGVRVVESAMIINGPVAGYMLGDLGAEVIKIEPPVTGDQSRGMQSIYDVQFVTPDGRSMVWEFANRNKRSVVLDLNNKEGRGIFYRLIEKSDIFLTNYRPGALQKLKIDYETLKQHNSKLIYAKNTGFGSKGFFAGKPAWDMTAQAFSGAMWIVGDRDFPEPAVTVGSVFDMVGASFLAYGIVAALVARERTGIGQQVDCSLLSGAIHIQAMNISSFLWANKSMSRFSRTRCRNPLTNHYKCADGKWLLLCEPSSKNWEDICSALGMHELVKDPRCSTGDARRQNYAEVISVLDRVFATKTRDEWMKIFSGYDFSYSPVYDYADVVNDTQILENGYVTEMDHAILGKMKTIGFPVQFSETPASIRNSAPEFGQHTEEVIGEILGYSWDEIADLRDKGAFG
jgi:crotonobetainyl-CoA:carnitine CoA-transferase CaiB-like acyl-CoA transferase